MFKFEVVTLKRALSSKSFILDFDVKIIHANQVKGDFAHFVLHEPHGIGAQHLTYRKVLF